VIAHLREHWRGWATLVLLVVAFSYAGIRIRRELGPTNLPDWMQYTEHRSHGIPRTALRQFERVMQLVEQNSREKRRELGSLHFLELAADPAASVLWRTETIVNRGYMPTDRIERDAGSAGASLLGYYTLGGKPIRYATRFEPEYPQMTPVTLFLPQPLAVSATQLILRRERFAVELRAPSNRNFEFTLPPRGWTRNPAALHVSAVWLGPDAALVSHSPATRCTSLTSSDGPLLVWLDPPPGALLKVGFARR
jgi:hypothetical protein